MGELGEVGSLDGEMEKKKKGVLTVVLVWGWTGREALGETGVCFCSDDCREKRKEKYKYS